MDEKTQKVLDSLKNKKVGVFVDDSNLYHAYRKYGWRVDFEKLKKLLEGYCDLQFVNYHVVIPHKSDVVIHGTDRFLKKIENFVTLKKKKLKYTPVAGKVVKKADVDVEVVLDVVRNIDKLDVAVVMSGDSDYLELRNYVVKNKKKKIIFFGYKENMAWELRLCWHLYINRIRDEIGLK